MQFASAEAKGGNMTSVLTTGLDASHHPTTLLYTKHAGTSYLMGGNDTHTSKLRNLSQQENPAIVYENHHEGVTNETYTSDGQMSNIFEIVSFSHDRAGRQYISTVEGVAGLPFFG